MDGATLPSGEIESFSFRHRDGKLFSLGWTISGSLYETGETSVEPIEYKEFPIPNDGIYGYESITSGSGFVGFRYYIRPTSDSACEICANIEVDNINGVSLGSFVAVIGNPPTVTLTISGDYAACVFTIISATLSSSSTSNVATPSITGHIVTSDISSMKYAGTYSGVLVTDVAARPDQVAVHYNYNFIVTLCPANITPSSTSRFIIYYI